jgi:hypothetical protein
LFDQRIGDGVQRGSGEEEGEAGKGHVANYARDRGKTQACTWLHFLKLTHRATIESSRDVQTGNHHFKTSGK